MESCLKRNQPQPYLEEMNLVVVTDVLGAHGEALLAPSFFSRLANMGLGYHSS